jgi:hypothetical protein
MGKGNFENNSSLALRGRRRNQQGRKDLAATTGLEEMRP